MKYLILFIFTFSFFIFPTNETFSKDHSGHGNSDRKNPSHEPRQIPPPQQEHQCRITNGKQICCYRVPPKNGSKQLQVPGSGSVQ